MPGRKRAGAAILCLSLFFHDVGLRGIAAAHFLLTRRPGRLHGGCGPIAVRMGWGIDDQSTTRAHFCLPEHSSSECPTIRRSALRHCVGGGWPRTGQEAQGRIRASLCRRRGAMLTRDVHRCPWPLFFLPHALTLAWVTPGVRAGKPLLAGSWSSSTAHCARTAVMKAACWLPSKVPLTVC